MSKGFRSAGRKLKRVGKDALSIATLGTSNYIDNVLHPDLPKQPGAPDPAPIADDEEVARANKRKAARRSKAGRAGTVLTEGGSLG